MKKIKVNGQLFKHLIFILVYLRLFIFFISSISSTIFSYGASGGFSRLYERLYFSYDYILFMGLVLGICLVYIIVFVAFLFFSYLRFFLNFISRDIWVIKIVVLEADEVGVVDELSKTSFEGKSPEMLKIEEYLERHLRRNITGLLFLMAFSIFISVIAIFIG